MKNSLKNIKLKNILKINSERSLICYGEISFLIGIIFLSSALPISILFLLFSIILGIKNNLNKIFCDKWNIALLCLSILMILSCSARLFITSEYELSYLAKNSWLYIVNWIPLFISFYGFQFYLQTTKQRILFGKAFLISNFPVIFSSISQYWFNNFGPFSTFFGLITWYQKPFENSESGITGLFSNPNYAGYWLATILPFSFYFFWKNKEKQALKYFFLLNFLFILYLLVNTSSRNAVISVLCSTLLIINYKLIIITLFTLSFLLIIINILNPFLLLSFVEALSFLIPVKLVDKFLLFTNLNINSFHRVDIFRNALDLILKRPIFGWGANTFGILYLLRGGTSPATHTHNLILELTYNYGILVSLVLTLFIFNLLFKFWVIIKKDNYKKVELIDKIWFVSTLTSVLFHMNDIPYYDGKISIIFWLLIAGVKCIISEKDFKNINQSNLKKII